MGQLFKPTFVDQHCVTVASDKGEARGHDNKDLVALSLVSHHHAACQAYGVNAGRQRLRRRKSAEAQGLELSWFDFDRFTVLALGDLPVAKFVWSQSATIPSPLLFFANLAIDAMNE